MAYTDNKAAQIGVTTTLSILVVTNLIGNTLVILIILTNKSMKTPINYLLVNLAVADMIFGLFVSPSYIFKQFFTHPEGKIGSMMCKLLTGECLAWIGAAASVFSLVAMSFERYFAVMHPLSTKLKLDMSKVKLIVAVCWIFAVVLNIPLFVTTIYEREYEECAEEWPKQKLWLAKAYSALWFIFSAIIPVTTMFALYSRVIYTLWFKSSEHQVQSTQIAMLKSRKRVTKMIVFVSFVYCFCWSPTSITYLLYHYDIEFEHMDIIYIIYIYAMVLVTCNSAINPFIYTLQSGRFRRHMKELVCCRQLRRNRVSELRICMNNLPRHATPRHPS